MYTYHQTRGGGGGGVRGSGLTPDLSHTRCHNHLCNMFVEFCHCAHLRVRVESGSGCTPDLSHTRPVDVLALNWERWKHAAFDITLTSPLIPSILTAAYGEGRGRETKL